ncbi:hypothetical protein HMPREF0663_11599 [Hoylesella oralis ATCC 33269]|uniref:Uncharacterized protein n=1 Tax=Hoylesella oralis ATCC 33269 TaxID=873533 RepID=E7RQZ8_9BACT|nr:hypothetical protein [Hoylesella oralis]EFZ36686.1 hypothetical protein HMPREF0663_11599 [Hoylesella oralis ATCC 33269]
MARKSYTKGLRTIIGSKEVGPCDTTQKWNRNAYDKIKQKTCTSRTGNHTWGEE